jgi:16S rRNA (adenine1518-N6/adenine1519-N6)-dimethyltransferase
VEDRPAEPTASGALRRHGLRPRKRLGQNFLRDRRFVARILEAAQVGPQDDVLEIGAGTGILTGALSRSARSVIAVELDDALARVLESELSGFGNVEIWRGNALDFDPCRHFAGPYKLVGNIPYYITGPILRHYLESACLPRVLVLMVQREVAERMTAWPGRLSLLGVSVQFYAEPRIVMRVPRGAFYPPPRVDSAVVRLLPRPQPVSPDLRDTYFRVVRSGFGTRRKTLANALSIGLDLPRDQVRTIIQSAGIDDRLRAEDLSLEQWARLTRVFAESQVE